ncbi:DUF6902 family protein [Jhaorihella thermophila]
MSGRPNFVQAMTRDRMSFHRPAPSAGPLREVSQCMFRLDDARSDDWETMRPLVFDAVTETGQQVLAAAEASSTRFAEFFSGFARTGLRGCALEPAPAPVPGGRVRPMRRTFRILHIFLTARWHVLTFPHWRKPCPSLSNFTSRMFSSAIWLPRSSSRCCCGST